VKQPPYHLLKLHQMPLRNPDDLEPILRSKYLAVGTTLLYGNPALTEAGRQALLALKERQPIARTATFFIYEFPDAASLP
jgi:hypothetical protein